MVWNPYIDEPSHGSDADLSDEDYSYDDNVHLNVEDWQVKYSDELWELWGRVQQLIHDAFLEYTIMTECTFSDFAQFCYESHEDECDFVWIPYEANLSYIWRHIQDFLEDTGLYDEMMPGATFDHWVRFVSQHSKQNNITVY